MLTGQAARNLPPRRAGLPSASPRSRVGLRKSQSRGQPVTSANLNDHLRVDRYGDFVLTEAIRPAPHLPVVPREGFRIDTFRDRSAGLEVPVLAASVSREKLFDT